MFVLYNCISSACSRSLLLETKLNASQYAIEGCDDSVNLHVIGQGLLLATWKVLNYVCLKIAKLLVLHAWNLFKEVEFTRCSVECNDVTKLVNKQEKGAGLLTDEG